MSGTKLLEIPTIQEVKRMGKEKSETNLNKLLTMYHYNLPSDIKREVVSSIGRQNNNDLIYKFIDDNARKGIPMELIYQMYRTCLYKSKNDKRFIELGNRIKNDFDNEVISRMYSFYNYRKNRTKRKKVKKLDSPILLEGDSEQTLKSLPGESVNLIFTSPPYYNAREYNNYNSYKEYLEKMSRVVNQCHRVLEEGRFIIINVSPVIEKRAGREFESIRYPISYDFHKILTDNGFYFVDEILWVKPEPSVPNRIGGYLQTRKPLSYKPNSITESIMVYRKDCDYLIDKNISDYKDFNIDKDEAIDTSNCWYISPKSDKNHPAVFPEELCRRIIKYYSFKDDVVLDPFAGSGTFGRVAFNMDRIPIISEANKEYIKVIKENSEGITYNNIPELSTIGEVA